MTQLSLFDTMPPAHPRAARPDLPLLLGMSPDHVTGGNRDAQPNAHGIYADDDAERLILPMLRKNWQGVPTAEICLLHLPQGWLSRYSYQVGDAGGGHGLSPKWHGDRFLESRAQALDCARAQLLRRIGDCTGKEADRVRDWLAVLV